jgi:hypothetical protein
MAPPFQWHYRFARFATGMAGMTQPSILRGPVARGLNSTFPARRCATPAVRGGSHSSRLVAGGSYRFAGLPPGRRIPERGERVVRRLLPRCGTVPRSELRRASRPWEGAEIAWGIIPELRFGIGQELPSRPATYNHGCFSGSNKESGEFRKSLLDTAEPQL